jgi:hypothetical protein
VPRLTTPEITTPEIILARPRGPARVGKSLVAAFSRDPVRRGPVPDDITRPAYAAVFPGHLLDSSPTGVAGFPAGQPQRRTNSRPSTSTMRTRNGAPNGNRLHTIRISTPTFFSSNHSRIHCMLGPGVRSA